jgi:hypothetical protein
MTMSDSPDPDVLELQHGPIVSVAQFFEAIPSGQSARISLPKTKKRSDGGTQSIHLEMPDIQIYCDSEGCRGVRNFHAPHPGPRLQANSAARDFVIFQCRNCRSSIKNFAIRWECVGAPESAELRVFKFGEDPPFGMPPTPTRLLTIFGSNRDIYFKGRRAEAQGLGIGAFVYYRRVIENQKSRLFDAVIKAAERLGADPGLIAELREAQNETQFSTSVRHIRHALPDQLLVRGHNPLSLLHGPLSEGVHALSDDRCLELATAVRTVLTELAMRLGEVIEDQGELDAAVAKLLAVRPSDS